MIILSNPILFNNIKLTTQEDYFLIQNLENNSSFKITNNDVLINNEKLALQKNIPNTRTKSIYKTNGNYVLEESFEYDVLLLNGDLTISPDSLSIGQMIFIIGLRDFNIINQADVLTNHNLSLLLPRKKIYNLLKINEETFILD